MWGGFGMGGGFPARQGFEEQYHCYSVAYADKAHLEVSPFAWWLATAKKNMTTQHKLKCFFLFTKRLYGLCTCLQRERERESLVVNLLSEKNVHLNLFFFRTFSSRYTSTYFFFIERRQDFITTVSF
jgi:hypothetical protein